MAYYDEDIAMALEMIQEAGQQVQWQKTTTVLIDPERPWLGGNETTTVHTPFVCFVPEGSGDYGMSQFIPQTEVGKYSTFGLMGVQDFEPRITDTVLRDGQPLVIETINTLKPASQIVLYILGIV